MLAAAASGVMVIHHPLAAASLLGSHPCADCGHDPAGLVPGDHWLGATLESRAGIPRLEGSTVDVQVTAAHTRRFDLEHHVAGTRRGVGEVAQFELAVTDKHDAFHAILPRAFWSTRAIRRPACLHHHGLLVV